MKIPNVKDCKHCELNTQVNLVVKQLAFLPLNSQIVGSQKERISVSPFVTMTYNNQFLTANTVESTVRN